MHRAQKISILNQTSSSRWFGTSTRALFVEIAGHFTHLSATNISIGRWAKVHMYVCAAEVNPVSVGTSWQRPDCLGLQTLKAVSLPLTHTYTNIHSLGLVFGRLPLSSSPPPPLASRVSHCLQAFHSLSPCSDAIFPFNHNPFMWWHDTGPGLVFPPSVHLLGQLLLSTSKSAFHHLSLQIFFFFGHLSDICIKCEFSCRDIAAGRGFRDLHRKVGVNINVKINDSSANPHMYAFTPYWRSQATDKCSFANIWHSRRKNLLLNSPFVSQSCRRDKDRFPPHNPSQKTFLCSSDAQSR